MSTTNDFIAELVRAANEVETLGSYEMAHLLESSLATIHDLRQVVGIPGSRTAADAVIALQTKQARIMRGDIDHRRVKAALFKGPI